MALALMRRTQTLNVLKKALSSTTRDSVRSLSSTEGDQISSSKTQPFNDDTSDKLLDQKIVKTSSDSLDDGDDPTKAAKRSSVASKIVDIVKSGEPPISLLYRAQIYRKKRFSEVDIVQGQTTLLGTRRPLKQNERGYITDFPRRYSIAPDGETEASKKAFVDSTYVAFTDGSFKPKEDENPQEGVKPSGSAVGFVVFENKKLIMADGEKCDENTVAKTEARGIRFLINGLLKNGIMDAKILSDNLPLVLALRGQGVIPTGCETIIGKIKKLIKKRGCSYKFIFVKRENNRLSDLVADLHLREEFPADFLESPPDRVAEILEEMKLYYHDF